MGKSDQWNLRGEKRQTVRDERGGVSEREEVDHHDERRSPASRFPPHGRQSGDALRREHVPREERQRGGEAPVVRDERHERCAGAFARG